MTKDEIIEYLVKHKKILEIGNQYFLPDEKPKNKTVYLCKNLPDKYLGKSISVAYDYFLNDCQIPLNSTGNLVYLLRTKTRDSELVLKKEILENPDIDYLTLTNNIKAYYKTSATKYPIAKFLTEGLWKGFSSNKLISDSNNEYVDTM